MTDKMTATERMRALLDERGVEHTDHENNATWWSDGNVECAYIQSMSDRLGQLSFMATPEQAVEATLGKGTCKLKQHGSLADQPNMVCWSCSECGFGWHHSINDKQFNYCPNCGRQVVE